MKNEIQRSQHKEKAWWRCVHSFVQQKPKAYRIRIVQNGNQHQGEIKQVHDRKAENSRIVWKKCTLTQVVCV